MFTECCSTEAPNSITSHGTRHISHWLGLPLHKFTSIDCNEMMQVTGSLYECTLRKVSKLQQSTRTIKTYLGQIWTYQTLTLMQVLALMLPTLPHHSNITTPEWRQPVNNAPQALASYCKVRILELFGLLKCLEHIPVRTSFTVFFCTQVHLSMKDTIKDLATILKRL